jgi:hypothetical protein
VNPSFCIIRWKYRPDFCRAEFARNRLNFLCSRSCDAFAGFFRHHCRAGLAKPVTIRYAINTIAVLMHGNVAVLAEDDLVARANFAAATHSTIRIHILFGSPLQRSQIAVLLCNQFIISLKDTFKFTETRRAVVKRYEF